jgi:guanylate cyclase
VSGEAGVTIGRLQRFGADVADDAETALRKQILVVVALLVAILAVGWGLLYVAFDEPGAGAIPLTYSVLSFVSLGVFAATRRFRFFRVTQLILILVLPFALQLELGGFVPSSGVVLWSLLAPIGGMLVATRRVGVALFVLFVGIVVAAGVVQPDIGAANELPDGLVATFFVLNVSGVASLVFVVVLYFVTQKDRAMELLSAEQGRSEALLLNVLPREIAHRLKDGQSTIAEHFASASVLFADIVGFTRLTAESDPDELIGTLNDVFLHFDDLVERYGCEKIRTIGDNYMVAAGVPTPRVDHAQALTSMALDMVAFAATKPGIDFRLGIDSGPLVAGVIGRSKFQYDLWGETVNTASRMESQGVPGRIQVTDGTRRLIENEFVCTSRGAVEVKGIGVLDTWFVDGRRADSDRGPSEGSSHA